MRVLEESLPALRDRGPSTYCTAWRFLPNSLLEIASAPPFGNRAPTPRLVSRELRTLERPAQLEAGALLPCGCAARPLISKLQHQDMNAATRSLSTFSFDHAVPFRSSCFTATRGPSSSRPATSRTCKRRIALLPSHSVENLTHDRSAARRHSQSLASR